MDPLPCTTPVFSLTRNPRITNDDVLQLCSQRLFSANSVASTPPEILNAIFGNTLKAEVIRNEASQLVKQSQSSTTPGFISTGVAEIDQLFGGGLPSNSIVELSGNRGVGKSLFCMQVCVTMQMQANPNHNKVLILSTDLSFTARRVSLLCERFNLDLDAIAQNIHPHHVFSTDYLLEKLQSAAKDTASEKYKLIIIDSITGLFKNHTSRVVEQVTRKEIFREITAAIYTLSKLHNATVILVHETEGYDALTDNVLPWKELIPQMDSNSFTSVYLQKIMFQKSGQGIQVTRLPNPFSQSTPEVVGCSVGELGIDSPSFMTQVDIQSWMRSIS